MINKPYSHVPQEENVTRRASWRVRLGRAFDLLLVVSAAILLFYTGSWAYRLCTGISLEESHPAFQVRLQISNASGQPGMEKPLARQWSGYADKLVAIDVVEQLGMAELAVPETFLILRDSTADLGPALTTALGLPSDRIVIKAMEADNHQVTATLVVGQDWATALHKRPARKI